MPRNKIIIVLTILVFNYSCKKPRLGEYGLYIDGVYTYFASLERSTTKSLVFALGNFSGVLQKHNKKVSGTLELNSGTKYPYTILVEGKIKHDGLIDYEIEGTYDENGRTRLFRISKLRE
jgi:hypothetical protein